ncbi:MAG: TQXA domain-containing protein, partial [Mycobacterium sp.]
MTRYRGGTYSHTVDKIVFTDGSTARTDLIRLNPNLQAYSLD